MVLKVTQIITSDSINSTCFTSINSSNTIKNSGNTIVANFTNFSEIGEINTFIPQNAGKIISLIYRIISRIWSQNATF